MSSTQQVPQRRQVRHRELSSTQHATAPRAIDEIYDDELDVLTVRAAMDPLAIDSIWNRLSRDTPDNVWARPNEKMPVEDVQLLGADAPATPSYSAPRGVSFDDYLASARRHAGELEALFGPDFPLVTQFEKLLGRFSGGRPARVARAVNGQSYAPCTVRRMAEGRQIGVHHDYHFGLPLYQELAPTIDTRTLVSFVVTMHRPLAGGELHVYGVTPDTPNAPRMPNGFQWDLAAIEAGYDQLAVQYEIGDLFLLAAGRCLHRVARVQGPAPRVTLGGFLALDKAHQQVLFWS
jgi:hypothetical protein